MLCAECHRALEDGADRCRVCGAPVNGAVRPLDLVLPDGKRLPLVRDVVIGRAPSSTVRLEAPTVSRTHARILASPDGATASVEDAGSSFGTFLDGHEVHAPAELHDGSRIQLGDEELVIERRRRESEAGRTLHVATMDSLSLPAGVPSGNPRLRRGYALKRLEAAEGEKRWVLRWNRDGGFARMSDGEAELLGLLDGRSGLADLVPEAERRLGADGPAVLVRLLGELAERGALARPNSSAGDGESPAPIAGGRLARLTAGGSRSWAWAGAGDFFDALYRGGGWRLFTRPALIAVAALAVVGLGVFAGLVAGRYGTPFVVASKVGLGGLVFLVGRFAIAALHEAAHALTMACFGRRVGDAGLKLVLVFPYVYVDTSDAWFEPRRRRMAVSAAGPASDLTLGGVFSILCLLAPVGVGRDVFFQLAFGAYVATFFNLNPLLPRDGYHVLVDALREPRLRERAREQFRRRLAGRRDADDSDVLARYSRWSVAWSLVGGALAVVVSLRYEKVFAELAPGWLVWPVMVLVWIALFLPVIAMFAGPLLERRRTRPE